MGLNHSRAPPLTNKLYHEFLLPQCETDALVKGAADFCCLQFTRQREQRPETTPASAEMAQRTARLLTQKPSGLLSIVIPAGAPAQKGRMSDDTSHGWPETSSDDGSTGHRTWPTPLLGRYPFLRRWVQVGSSAAKVARTHPFAVCVAD